MRFPKLLPLTFPYEAVRTNASGCFFRNDFAYEPDTNQSQPSNVLYVKALPFNTTFCFLALNLNPCPYVTEPFLKSSVKLTLPSCRLLPSNEVAV